MSSWYRTYLQQAIDFIEVDCMTLFRTDYWRTAYKCRKFFSGADVVIVRVADRAYLPMTRDRYVEWRRLKRQLKKINVE